MKERNSVRDFIGARTLPKEKCRVEPFLNESTGNRKMNMDGQDGQDRKTGNAWPSGWVLGGRGDGETSCSFFLRV
jgi:hypothetical protein